MQSKSFSPIRHWLLLKSTRANHALNQPISRSISSLDQPLNNEQYVTGWSQFGSIRAAAGAVPAFTPARLPIARLTLRLTAYPICGKDATRLFCVVGKGPQHLSHCGAIMPYERHFDARGETIDFIVRMADEEARTQ